MQAAELVLAHAASSSSLQWIGYLSSTGVYGGWGGSWVDERLDIFILVQSQVTYTMSSSYMASGNQDVTFTHVIGAVCSI